MILNKTKSHIKRYRIIPGTTGSSDLPINHVNHSFQIVNGIDRGNGYQGMTAISYFLKEKNYPQEAKDNCKTFLEKNGYDSSTLLMIPKIRKAEPDTPSIQDQNLILERLYSQTSNGHREAIRLFCKYKKIKRLPPLWQMRDFISIDHTEKELLKMSRKNVEKMYISLIIEYTD